MKKKLKIIGLNAGEINSSAALLIDGKAIIGAQEERFNRKKFTRDFPYQSINYCLSKNGISLSDLNAISQGWNPGAHMKKFNSLISKTRTYREHNLYTIPDNLFNLVERNPGDYIEVKFPGNSKMPSIFHIQHHRCHAANSFFLSNFNEAAIMTADLKGENECTTWGFGSENKLKILQMQNMPNSLGMFYSTYTSMLGYKPDSDEWKVMAMSAYDINCENILNKIKQTYQLLPNGKFQLNQRYYLGNSHHQNKEYSKELLDFLGVKTGKKTNKAQDWQKKIAKAMQICSEEIALHFLNHLFDLTNSDKVVLGGGFFLNSVFNGKIIKKTKFKKCYVPYAPSDTGNSIGSALYTHHVIFGAPRTKVNNTALIGPSFSDNAIKLALGRRNIKYKKIDNLPKEVAKQCSRGKIVAFFSGSMEFGDRALGCRSILADPRISDMKDKINKLVKYREEYRPFAPSVIAEKASLFFDVEKDFSCRYMEKVVNVRRQYIRKLPAIVHLDGSARVQTVAFKENPLFFKILKEFEKLSTFPILLNTSLNVNGEPLAASPDDALTTFYNSGLDIIFLGNYLIKK